MVSSGAGLRLISSYLYLPKKQRSQSCATTPGLLVGVDLINFLPGLALNLYSPFNLPS
jgi:hypothetical protein